VPGPVRQIVSTETLSCGVAITTRVNVGNGVRDGAVVGVGVNVSGPVIGITG